MNLLSLKNRTPLQRLLALSAMYAGPGVVEETATGNPLVFSTSIANPLKSLLIPFTPKQTGSGDPSPSNIRPIVPWEGLKLSHTGKNLYDKTAGNTGVWWNGKVLGAYTDYRASDKIPVVPNAKYTLSKSATGQNQVEYFDKNGDYLNQSVSHFGTVVYTITIPSDVYFITFNIANTALDTAQFEVGQTATAYEPYKPVTETDIPFPSPVYGGTLDAVTGVLTVEWVMASFKRTVFGAVQEGALDYRQYTDSTLPVAKTDGSSWYNARREQKSNICVIANPYSETSFGNLIGVVFSIDAFQKKPTFRISDALYQSLTDTDDIEFVYELATPQEITLTPQQIVALSGNNTIWSDADGTMTAVYFNKG